MAIYCVILFINGAILISLQGLLIIPNAVRAFVQSQVVSEDNVLVKYDMRNAFNTAKRDHFLEVCSLLLLSTPLHQRAAESSTRNHVAASSLSPQVARKGSTLSGFVQRSRLEREVGRDLHSNKWEEV